MNELLMYIIKSTLTLSVLYLIFRLMLRRQTFFALNRTILLGILICSVCIPLIHLPAGVEPVFKTETILLTPAVAMETENRQPAAMDETADSPSVFLQIANFSFMQWVSAIYWLGVIVSLIISFCSIVFIFSKIRKARIAEANGRRIYISAENIPAMSFGRFILISESDFRENSETIIAHETAHIRQLHFLDLLLAETVKAFHWFNPLVYMLQRDLKQIHEYQVDSIMLKQGADAYGYQLLLISKCVGQQRFAFANNFNHCQIKKRIVMMNKQKTRNVRRWTAAAFIPALALMLMAFGKESGSGITGSFVARTQQESGSENDVSKANSDKKKTNFPIKNIKSVSDVVTVSAFGSQKTGEAGEPKIKEGEYVRFYEGNGSDKVYAFADGEVALIEKHHENGFVVKIRHKDYLDTVYGNNSKILVKVGDKIRAGQAIAVTGTTSRFNGTDGVTVEFLKIGRSVDQSPYLE